MTMPTEGWFQNPVSLPESALAQNVTVPEGLAVKCVKCGAIHFNKDFERNLKVCPRCSHHHRLSSADRIAYTVDENSFVEFGTDLCPLDPLNFPDYADKLKKSLAKVGEGEAFRVGYARIDTHLCILGVAEFAFQGGTLGSVVGEKIARALETGLEQQTPVVFFTASGGARMQEGLIALMQMAKTAAAVARLAQSPVPFIVVLTDPTTGGVLASYASLGDILIAEPGASIAFAGARVAAQAQNQKLPADYQTSEWRLAHGQIDMIVARRDMKTTLARLLSLTTSKSPTPTRLAAPAKTKSAGNGHVSV
jgi:acetyl-CoA carboxylase carboxyl transferase subunit beta